MKLIVTHLKVCFMKSLICVIAALAAPLLLAGPALVSYAFSVGRDLKVFDIRWTRLYRSSLMVLAGAFGWTRLAKSRFTK